MFDNKEQIKRKYWSFLKVSSSHKSWISQSGHFFVIFWILGNYFYHGFQARIIQKITKTDSYSFLIPHSTFGVYAVVNLLLQVIGNFCFSFVFGYGDVCLWSWNKRKITWDKKLTTTYTFFTLLHELVILLVHSVIFSLYKETVTEKSWKPDYWMEFFPLFKRAFLPKWIYSYMQLQQGCKWRCKVD